MRRGLFQSFFSAGKDSNCWSIIRASLVPWASQGKGRPSAAVVAEIASRPIPPRCSRKSEEIKARYAKLFKV